MQDSPENSAGELVPAQIALGQEAVPSLPVCPSLPAASSSLVCLEVESSDEEMASLEKITAIPTRKTGESCQAFDCRIQCGHSRDGDFASLWLHGHLAG